MAEPIRVGVVGAGNFGRRHIAIYGARPDVRLVGVAERDPELARAVANRWGIPAFANAQGLLDACRPDAISVVTPAQYHLEPAVVALERNCAVLLEKPVAMSVDEVDTLEAAARGSSAFVVPAHLLRFARPYAAAKEQVCAGAVGQVIALATRRDRGRGHAQLFSDVHPAMMTLIHDIDMALWITGATASRVVGWERAGLAAHQPVVVWAHVEASDGSLWSLRTNWLLPDDVVPVDALEVVGTDGVLSLDLRPDLIVASGRGRGEGQDGVSEVTAAALEAEIAHFCDCVRMGAASSVVTLAEAREGIRVAEAIVTSARAGGLPIDLRP
jgi:predicted dehydrogenase